MNFTSETPNFWTKASRLSTLVRMLRPLEPGIRAVLFPTETYETAGRFLKRRVREPMAVLENMQASCSGLLSPPTVVSAADG